MRKYSMETLVTTMIVCWFYPAMGPPVGTRAVILVSRTRESQRLTALTESSAAAIGHSKQRRG
jgi:hypothetical protein